MLLQWQSDYLHLDLEFIQPLIVLDFQRSARAVIIKSFHISFVLDTYEICRQDCTELMHDR